MRRHRKSIWGNGFAGIGISAAAGLLIMTVATAFFSVLTFFLIKSMTFSHVFTCISTAVGGCTGGYVCGRYRRRNGLAEGIICGLVMAVMLSLAGLCLGGGFIGIKKLLLLTLSGAAGGVSGVNSKRPQNLMD